ncbi:MAG: OmpH family outer membrane protein, partial [Muribaculaceae bacterium]|nr:OmpH family outer membrane protein [Muribaculaceae bacterium]
MLKNLILALLIALPSFAFGQKFGVIDTPSILTAMPEAKDMEATLSAASKKYEDELKNLQDKFNKEYTDYQNLAADTPESIKQRRAQELQELQQKMDQFMSSAQ